MSKKHKNNSAGNHSENDQVYVDALPKQPKGMVVRQTTTNFSGPLPHPQILEHYNAILPGAAERILKMAEDQSEHRRKLESEVIFSGINNSKKGLLFGFIIGITGLIGSVIISLFGQAILGGVIGISTLTALVGVFVYGTSQQKAEREKKRENMNV